MNILVLNYEFPPLGGGAGNANLEIFREFSKIKELKIDFITSSEKNKFEIENFSDNITIHKLNVNKKDIHYWSLKEIFMYTVKAKRYIKKLLKEKEYDLCHCFFTLPCGLISYFFRKKMKYIVSLRGSDVPGFNDRLWWFLIPQKMLSKLIWSKSSEVIANSQGLKELALKTNKRQEISVIYNGIDTKEFFPKKKKSKEITVLTVSRLISRKGLEFLIKAMPEILKENNNVKLIIAGDGPKKNNLEKLAKSLGVLENVALLGYVEHKKLPNLYRNADIFILPSLYEGMSNTILEAMASGLPIITTDTGGTKELIKGNGIIIKKRSNTEIADAVNKIIKDKLLKDTYSKKSRELALNLNWHNLAKQYYELYKKVI